MPRAERSPSPLTAASVAACLIGLAVLGVYGAKRARLPGPASASGKSNRELVETCTLDMYTQFHVHPELTIMIDGEKRTIPANVGIDDGCMHPLHTHDATGLIHVEAPVKRDFTLGDFFYVWGKPFDRDHLLDKTVDDRHEIRLLVNGRLSSDYERLVLHDHDKVMIAYREKPATP